MTDLRDAFRALKSTPIVTAVAILSLALGIGANTAIFSILDAVMLRVLPVKDPARLTIISMGANDNRSFTNPIWEQVRDRQDAHRIRSHPASVIRGSCGGSRRPSGGG